MVVEESFCSRSEYDQVFLLEHFYEVSWLSLPCPSFVLSFVQLSRLSFWALDELSVYEMH